MMIAQENSTAQAGIQPPLSPVREKWTNIVFGASLVLAIVALFAMGYFRARSEGPDSLTMGAGIALLVFGIPVPLAASAICAVAALILGKFRRLIWVRTAMVVATYAAIGFLFYWPTPSSLLLATATDDLPQARWCLRLGISPDSCNYWTWNRPRSRGQTALTQAIQRRNIEMVKLLLDHGADVNLVDGFQRSPMKCAIDTGNQEMMDLLAARGAAIPLAPKQP